MGLPADTDETPNVAPAPVMTPTPEPEVKPETTEKGKD